MTDAHDPPPRDDTLSALLDRLVKQALDAAAAAQKDAAEQLAATFAEAKERPAEMVNGAFGLGYLVGKALFGKWR